jgi:DNA repair protein RadC
MPKKTIDGLLADEMPYEKCKKAGPASLTDPELLAVFLRTGLSGVDVLKLSREILSAEEDGLYGLVHKSVKELLKLRGIGEVKAIEILAALELSRRYQLERFDDEYQVTTSKDAYDLLSAKMGALPHEEIWIVMLNRSKHVLGVERISSGGTSLAVGDLKMILKPAIEHLSDSIILAHNHPSDNATPSNEDRNITKRIAAACATMGVTLLDHIIVCRGAKYYSFIDHGDM